MNSLAACLVALAVGCSGESSHWSVSGQIFIVTAGRENVRLGLVTVRAIDFDQMRSFLEARRHDLSTLRIALTSRAQTLQSRKASAIGQRDRFGQEFDRVWDNYVVDDGAEAEAVRRRIGEKSTELKEEIARTDRMIGSLEREIAAVHDSMRADPGFFFHNMPVALDSTKTDADGEFRLSLRGSHPIVLVAAGERQIFFSREIYHWVVLLEPAKSGGERRVFLSNDNLVGSGSPESLLHSDDFTVR